MVVIFEMKRAWDEFVVHRASLLAAACTMYAYQRFEQTPVADKQWAAFLAHARCTREEVDGVLRMLHGVHETSYQKKEKKTQCEVYKRYDTEQHYHVSRIEPQLSLVCA